MHISAIFMAQICVYNWLLLVKFHRLELMILKKKIKTYRAQPGMQSKDNMHILYF